MGFIKPAGSKAAYEHKHLKLHGSAPKRDQLRRLAEKPKGPKGSGRGR